MNYKLHVKLIFSYIFITFFVVGLVALITNITFEDAFKKYVIKTQQTKNENVVQTLANEYKLNNKFDNSSLEKIGVNSLENGLIIKVMDNDNNTIWDAMEHNSGMCAQMLAEMAHNMEEFYHDFHGEYTDEKYDIVVDDRKVGEVLIGYYGPYYFTENDIALLKSFNNILIVAIVVAIFISICLGYYMSKKTSKPIVNVTKATKSIADGNYKKRISENSSTVEIIELMDAVNDLALTLEHQEGIRKELTSNIAHELRTPIATLRSHLEAIKDGVWQLNEERIDSLYEEIIRISKIVDDLDKLDNYDSNMMKLDISEFDIKKLIKKIINNFENDAREKKVSITLNGDECLIKADQGKISQVFINLISNALRYTKKDGYINVRIESVKNNVKIIVKDNGVGISSNDLPHIFERFYRADKSRARVTGGSGIGLSIVKNIIELHKGSIRAESKLGRGTTFTITMPK